MFPGSLFWMPLFPLLFLLSIFVFIIVYFLPSLLAFRKQNVILVFILNLFFGWTILGWIFCLILALVSGPMPPSPSFQSYDKPLTKKCPFCAETIQMEAIICRFCQRDIVKPEEPMPAQPIPQAESVEPSVSADDPNRWKPLS